MNDETPGAYLQRCREAAKLTVGQLGQRAADHRKRIACAVAARQISEVETDTPGQYFTLANEIAASGVLPKFDLNLFLTLCARSCPAPAAAAEAA